MTIYVFLNNQYADWEIGYLLPELIGDSPAPHIHKNKREVVTFGLNGESVRSMGGLRVTPEMTLDKVDAGTIDALILPGGEFWSDFNQPKFDALVRDVAMRGKLVAGICAATAYLGRLGLLDGVEHTSNSQEFLRRSAPKYAGAALYKNQSVVAHCNIVTASGLMAVDFTDKLLRLLDVYEPRICDIWYNMFKHGIEPRC